MRAVRCAPAAADGDQDYVQRKWGKCGRNTRAIESAGMFHQPRLLVALEFEAVQLPPKFLAFRNCMRQARVRQQGGGGAQVAGGAGGAGGTGGRGVTVAVHAQAERDRLAQAHMLQDCAVLQRHYQQQ